MSSLILSDLRDDIEPPCPCGHSHEPSKAHPGDTLYPFAQCEEAFMRAWPSARKNIESSLVAAFTRQDVPNGQTRLEVSAVLTDIEFNVSRLVRYYVLDYLRSLERH